MLVQLGRGLGPARAWYKQELMRKGKINIHTVRRKSVGSCTLGWGQEQEQLGALAQRLSRAL